jgi:hypothetical protein
MDFLTRLAQRLTGELPVVQPRLPLLFEPTAGSARAVEEGGEVAIPAAREPEELTPPPLSTRLAPTAPAPLAPRDAPLRLDPLRPPMNLPGLTELSPTPALPFLAPKEGRDISGGPSGETSAHTILQPASHLTPPRRAVPVLIRPAASTGTPPISTSTALRRSAVARAMHDAAKPGRVGGTGEREQGPPAIHVHIGRVDVRAVLPSAAAPRPAAPPAAPRATLEDYLSGRKGGSQP